MKIFQLTHRKQMDVLFFVLGVFKGAVETYREYLHYTTLYYSYSSCEKS